MSPDVAWFTTIDTGEVLLTTNGGDSFDEVAPPEGFEEGLQWFDIEAEQRRGRHRPVRGRRSGRTGSTTPKNGGDTWEEAFRSEDDSSFFNCMAFFDDQRGVAQGDPVDGKMQILITDDGGASWELSPALGMPTPFPVRSAGPLAGACINATGKKAWFGSGGADGNARIFHPEDYGMTWTRVGLGHRGLRVRRRHGRGLPDEQARPGRRRRLHPGTRHVAQDDAWRSDMGDRRRRADVLPDGIAWWSDMRGDERTLITPEQKTVFVVGHRERRERGRGKTWQPLRRTPLNSIGCLTRSSIWMAAALVA